jgi:hypothetical protein
MCVPLFAGLLLLLSPPDGDSATHFSVIFPPPYFQYGHTISACNFIDLIDEATSNYSLKVSFVTLFSIGDEEIVNDRIQPSSC